MIRLSGSDRHPSAVPTKGRILYLTNQSPLPAYSGGQVREWQFLSRLSACWDVDFVAVTLHVARDVAHAAPLLQHVRTATFFGAEPSAAAPGTPERIREVACPGTAGYLADLAGPARFDFVHVEGYFLMHHLPDDLGLPVFLAEENIEYELEKARQELGSLGDRPDWTVTRALEHEAWDRAAACGAVAPHDVAVIRDHRQDDLVHWLPPGCDHFAADDPGGDQLERVPPSRNRVVYTGSAAWGPSRDGTLHLIRDVWPLVLAEVPDAQLVIAGDGQTREELRLGDLHRSVHLCGAMPSLGPVLCSATVYVCPLRFGSGVKSKMLEAIHAGCAIVSTSTGLQGLQARPRQAIWHADAAADLAAGITALLRDPRLRDDLRARASAAAADLVTWAEATARLQAAWSTMPRRAARVTAPIQQD